MTNFSFALNKTIRICFKKILQRRLIWPNMSLELVPKFFPIEIFSISIKHRPIRFIFVLVKKRIFLFLTYEMYFFFFVYRLIFGNETKHTILMLAVSFGCVKLKSEISIIFHSLYSDKRTNFLLLFVVGCLIE